MILPVLYNQQIFSIFADVFSRYIATDKSNDLSTKRMLNKAEFERYNTSERTLPSEDISAVKTQNPPVEQTPKAPTKDSKQPETTLLAETIPTSEHRFNIYEDWQPDFRPTVAYLQFLSNGKFRKITEYNWTPELLTLSVYDEDVEGCLILAYENGYVAKVPVAEILKFDDNSSYTRYSDARLIFASLAHADDAIMSVTEENKGAYGRAMMRIDTLSGIKESKLADYGERFYNEGMARRIIQIDVIPHEYKRLFGYIVDKDKRTLGFPAKTLAADIKLALVKVGISLRLK